MTGWLWAALAAAVVSAAAVALARRALLGSGIVDHPGERRSHDRPMPRGGGVAPIAVWLVWLAGLAMIRSSPALWLIAGCATAIAALGLWDDLRSPPIWIRLAGQMLVAATTVLGMTALGVLPDAPWQLGVGFFGLLWLVNAYNFMDGIDGLAAWQAVFAAVGLGWLAAGDAVAAAVVGLAAAVAGFIPWNWPRARIFLGDVGSTTIGYGLGALALMAVGRAGVAVVMPLLLLAVFLVDATATLALRIWRRERWYTPHRRHTYQLLVAQGFSHGQVVALYMAINLLLVAPAVWIARQSAGIAVEICVGVYLVLFVAWLLGRR